MLSLQIGSPQKISQYNSEKHQNGNEEMYMGPVCRRNLGLEKLKSGQTDCQTHDKILQYCTEERFEIFTAMIIDMNELLSQYIQNNETDVVIHVALPPFQMSQALIVFIDQTF